jgi:hypothetical protein
MTEDEKAKNDLAKMIPLLKILDKNLQKASVLQYEMRKNYPLTSSPIDGSCPSERRSNRKKRPNLGLLMDKINKWSKVSKERIYHELVRAPMSREKAKNKLQEKGEKYRRGVKEAIKWCEDKNKKPHRGNIRNWFIKNRYEHPSDSRLSELIRQELLIINK